MEKPCLIRIVKRRITSCKGAAPFKTLIIFFLLMLVFAFTLQVLTVYSACNSVSTSVRRAVMSVAALNKAAVFSSLREGNTYCGGSRTLITETELADSLTEEFGLTRNGGALEKTGSSGDCIYKIRDMTVTLINADSLEHEINMLYSVDFTLDIPVAAFWDFGTFSVPMTVSAQYTAKY